MISSHAHTIKNIMRTIADRLRHSILFEIFGVLTCAPLAAYILDKDLIQVGAISIVLSLFAMCFNYVFNLAFDKILIKKGMDLRKRPVGLRVLHATLFEFSLIIFTVPMVAWWLDMTLYHALLADFGFVIFFLVYAFLYNWVYDVVFPVPISINANVNSNET